ncbi:MAG: glycosyltransferase [Clostridia bacterium]|nr:glycosyltransferase [Clostridia bacterium]
MKKLSIIIPVYNSALSLKALNKEMNDYFQRLDYKVEKIFVDDCSSDSSLEVLLEIQTESKTTSKPFEDRVKVIELKRNTGQQNALFCGLHYATGDLVLTLDDDLQHDISHVGPMLALLSEGYDLVYGVHAIAEGDIRSLGSKLTGYFFRKNYPALDGKRVSSFRVFKYTLAKEVLACDYAFIYLSALLLRQKPLVANIDIQKRARVHGRSGYNLKRLMILFLKLIWFYGNLVPECLKPTGEAYEESDDTRCGQLPAKCH